MQKYCRKRDESALWQHDDTQRWTSASENLIKIIEAHGMRSPDGGGRRAERLQRNVELLQSFCGVAKLLITPMMTTR